MTTQEEEIKAILDRIEKEDKELKEKLEQIFKNLENGDVKRLLNDLKKMFELNESKNSE